MFESFDQSAEVALEVSSALPRLEQFAIADLASLGFACSVVLHTTTHKLAEQFADRSLARCGLEHLPRCVVDVDTGHVVAPRRWVGGCGGLSGAGDCAGSVTSPARHDADVGAAPGGKVPVGSQAVDV